MFAASRVQFFSRKFELVLESRISARILNLFIHQSLLVSATQYRYSALRIGRQVYCDFHLGIPSITDMKLEKPTDDCNFVCHLIEVEDRIHVGRTPHAR